MSNRQTIHYTADVVLLTYASDSTLRVLLIERNTKPYALPGGDVDRDETARQAAVRQLGERSGIKLEPHELLEVGVYDDPDRVPRGRYVSVAFVALLDHTPTPTPGAASAKWAPAALIPTDLAFDHHAILADAVARARRQP